MEEKDLSDTLWVRISQPDLWKTQYCPKWLLKGLTVDMYSRHPESNLEFESVEEAAIDLPGIVRIDRTWKTIKIDTLSFSVPTSDFSYFKEKLRGLPKRVFNDGTPYYKLHGWLGAVIFGEEQRTLVLKAMDGIWTLVKFEEEQEQQLLESGLQQAEAAGHLYRPRPKAQA